MAHEQSLASIPALIERGKNFLSEEQFDKAFEYFNKVLDLDAKHVEAYWGVLMAEHQCKDLQTLLSRGIPIDHDTNYGYVVKYATEQTLPFYQSICETLHFTCHLRFMQTAREGKLFIMKKWAKHYADSVPNGPFIFYHDFLLENGGMNTDSPELPGALLRLYNIYGETFLSAKTELLAAAQESLNADAKQLVKQDYLACMKDVFDAMLTAQQPIDVAKNAAIWVEPTAAFAKKYNVAVELPAGLDKYPTDVAGRYLAILNAFAKRNFGGKSAIKQKLYDFVDAAQKAGGDEDACQRMREQLFVSILNNPKVTENDLAFLIKKHPDDHRPWEKRWILATDHLTAFGPDNATDKTFDKFMKVPAETRSQKQEEDILDYLKRKKKEIRDFQTTILADSKPLFDETVARAGDAAAEMKAKWDAYVAELERLTNLRTARVDERIAAVQQQIAGGNDTEIAKANRDSVVRAVLSLLIACSFIPGLVYALIKMNHPFSILEQYHATWFHIIGIAIALVGGALAFVLTRWLRPNKSKRFTGHKALNTVRNINPLLSVLGYVGVVVVLVLSAVNFTDKIGTLTIKDADDLIYMRRHPAGDYLLDADLDLGGDAITTMDTFAGTFDGQDHTISHFTVKKGHFIGTNSGTIKNLTLSDFETTSALLKKNSGELNHLSVKNGAMTSAQKDQLKYDALLLGQNKSKGKLVSCSITDSTYTFSCGEIDLGTAGGMIAKNAGSVIDCHVDMTMEGAYTLVDGNNGGELDIGTLIGNSSLSATVLGCSSTSTLQLTVDDRMNDEDDFLAYHPYCSAHIGGLIGNGRAERSYFSGSITMSSVCSDEGLIRPSNMDAYVYIGGLLGRGTASNCYASGSIKAEFVTIGSDYSNLQQFVGGVAGRIDRYDVINIENCYANISCSFIDHDDTYDYAPLVGYSIANATPAMKNTFNYGSKKISRSKGTICPSGSVPSEGIYYSKSMFPDDNSDYVLSTKKLKSKSFITKTLGWDTDIWKVTDGKLPTLIPVETAEDVDETEKEG